MFAAVQLRGERYAIRTKNTDRGSSAHGQCRNRIDDFVNATRPLALDLERDRALIDKTNGISIKPNRFHVSIFR